MTTITDLLISPAAGIKPKEIEVLSPAWRARPLPESGGVAPSHRPTVLVLTPDEAARWLHDPSRSGNGETWVIVLWVGADASVPPALLDDPRIVGALDPRCSSDRTLATLQSAATAAARRGENVGECLERVLEIGRALASEKDLDSLLSLILTNARGLTNADGASVYTKDSSGGLFFRLWQNATTGDAPGLQSTPSGERSVAGYVARTGQWLALDDAYEIPPDAPYQFNSAFDHASGYRTRSMLTLPLTNKANEVVGVLQLINRKDSPDVFLKTPEAVEQHVRPFNDMDRRFATALAGQAGVALENSMLYADIERLFEGFIKASVRAIEARDPTTAGHSFRVADFTERLAVAVDRNDTPVLRGVRFTRDEMRELRYASLLHDFGKVGVREYVLVKAKKLVPHQLDILKHRFRYARVSIERRALRAILALQDRQMTAAEFARARQEIETALAAETTQLSQHLELVLKANEPNVTAEQVSAELAKVSAFRFPGEEGEEPLLLDFEFADLSLPKGSLNSEERAEIESHVSHTYAFLTLIPWTKNLANLPRIAYAHHEKLDGTGYPKRLPGAEIPVQSRMMTISDIYDALTAGDRPYKRGMPPERALDILAAEAKAGKIDNLLLGVFVESAAWRAAS